jgi:receptor expression-enhancing protein 5/6
MGWTYTEIEYLTFKQGAKQLYMNHLRPFLLRHQARVDLIMGLAYGEMVCPLYCYQV